MAEEASRRAVKVIMNGRIKTARAGKIDYQETLREIAKSMVRLNRPERLLKMITRYIDRELGLSHTSLLVLEEKQDRFTFVDSKGNRRIPMGLVKFNQDHPLVTWFQKKNGRHPQKGKISGGGDDDYLYRPDINRWVKSRSTKIGDELHKKFQTTAKAMDDLRVELAIPGYYKKNLLGMLLLGRKKNGRCFTDAEISFFQILVQDCSMAIKSAEYHRHLIQRNRDLEKHLKEIATLHEKERNTFYEILRSLAQEVHAKDAYTYGHVRQVERLGMITAKELGLDVTGKNKAILSAGLILHDVGKIGIPDRILNKPSRLDPEEWKVMQTHVEKGARILAHLSDFKEVSEIVHCHHENYDGSGYPRGLRRDQIPIQSRIVSAVDAFRAIVSTRCYSQGRPVEVAFQELRRCAGTQFDPDVVEALIRGVKKEMKRRGVGFFLDDSHQDGKQEPLKNAS